MTYTSNESSYGMNFINARDKRTVKMSQHITGLPTNLFETNRLKIEINHNHLNNKRYYDTTTTAVTN